MHTEKYFNVILNSIARHDDFWELLIDIQKNYFCSIKEEFYKLDNVESCIVEKITSEAITDIYDDVLGRISSEIEDNYYELEVYDDYYDITDYILSNIECDIYELIADSIRSKLDEHAIASISEDDFDIDVIISEDINVHEMIEREYDKIMYSQSDDFKENIKKTVKNIIALFEDVSFITFTE